MWLKGKIMILFWLYTKQIHNLDYIQNKITIYPLNHTVYQVLDEVILVAILEFQILVYIFGQHSYVRTYASLLKI